MVFKMYSDFTHFDYTFYALKKAIRGLDPDKTRAFMIEEPLEDTEVYRKQMIMKRFELTLKECQAFMKIGWEVEM